MPITRAARSPKTQKALPKSPSKQAATSKSKSSAKTNTKEPARAAKPKPALAAQPSPLDYLSPQNRSWVDGRLPSISDAPRTEFVPLSPSVGKSDWIGGNIRTPVEQVLEAQGYKEPT